MYTFGDIIKGKFLEEFAELSVSSVLLALLLAFVLGCYVVLIYRVTFRGVLFNRGFALSLILLSMITSLVILTVTSNVVLSLGMVGALSIVRFRTAVKDPLDTVFMFWAIVAGITTGAGLIYVSVFGTLVIGIVFVLVSLAGKRTESTGYLVIVRGGAEASAPVREALAKLKHCKIKSFSESDSGFEAVLELRCGKELAPRLNELKALEGVESVSATAYGSGTLL